MLSCVFLVFAVSVALAFNANGTYILHIVIKAIKQI